MIKGTTTLVAPSITGGTTATIDGFELHTFTSASTLTVPAGVSVTAELLVVAGGGGGGFRHAGGGGAGGLIHSTFTFSTDQLVNVGTGGAGSTSINMANGVSGSNSSFGIVLTNGGGGGATNNNPGMSGGSGGGGSNGTPGGSGIQNQGYSGGIQNGNHTNGFYPYGAGGGGAGSAGPDAYGNTGSNGGDGISYSISGSARFYAGGGGGGIGGSIPETQNVVYTGGSSIGGNGGTPLDLRGQNGQDNTGSGGGGGGGGGRDGGFGPGNYGSYGFFESGNGGNGGSGIVLVKFPSTHPTWSSSNAQIASVDQSGIVTGVSAGTVKITGSINSGTYHYTYTKTVTVEADTDGDGVADIYDDYPLDATRAYNNKTNVSTIAFEDLWPSKGDYDMNDLVMKYTYNLVTNAQNYVVQVISEDTLLATGGIRKNAFGIEFPIDAKLITTINSGVLEAGQMNAVFMLFSNMRTEMSTWNTIPGELMSPPKSYKVDFRIDGLSKVGIKQISAALINPFIVNYEGSSRREVHLPGKEPTILADKSVPGTADDSSNKNGRMSYETANGLPWAIILPTGTFNYPIETKDISAAYLHFDDWARSGGINFMSWYDILDAGNITSSLIYSLRK